jgi:hypothetical protein
LHTRVERSQWVVRISQEQIVDGTKKEVGLGTAIAVCGKLEQAAVMGDATGKLSIERRLTTLRLCESLELLRQPFQYFVRISGNLLLLRPTFSTTNEAW